MYYILDSEFPMLADTTYYDIDDGVEVEGVQGWARGLPFTVEPLTPIIIPITRIGESVDAELVPIPFNDANMCLANAEVATVLSRYPQNVTLYNATLVDTDTQKEYSYFALNIISLISKANLSADSVSLHIARLVENKNTIVISDQLKSELEHFPYLKFRAILNP